MSQPNYRQGFTAGLIMLVFFAGRAMADVHGMVAVVGSGVVVGVAVAAALLVLRPGAPSR